MNDEVVAQDVARTRMDRRVHALRVDERLALGREREEQSVEWAGRALALDPEEPQVLYNVGCAYALLGRVDERAYYRIHAGVPG